MSKRRRVEDEPPTWFTFQKIAERINTFSPKTKTPINKRKRVHEPLGTRNYYKIVPKQILQMSHNFDYAKKKLIKIHLPSGIAVIGATGSRKTNWVLNFIELVDTFDRVTIYAKKLDEPLYIYLIECLDKAGVKHEEFDHLDSVIPCSEYDSKQNNLVIIDDFMNAPKKSLEPIIDLFIMGRKNGITPIYIAQSYFVGIPQTIRNNISYLVIFKLRGKTDMARILSDASIDRDRDEMIQLLRQIRALGDTNFMLVDKVTNDPDLQLRVNFGTGGEELQPPSP